MDAPIRFLGACLQDADINVGWGDQPTTARANVVEDPHAGDRFEDPAPGSVARLEVGGLAFEGIVQRTSRSESAEGKPVFMVDLTDPRELLAGIPVLLSSFPGETSAIPNLLNPYGYWESRLGFGGSLSNESGMLWDAPAGLAIGAGTAPGVSRVGIRPALEAIVAGGTGFGGPLRMAGRSFGLDLSGMPPFPDHYRLGGVAPSLLDLVSQACQDAGHDFMVTLSGGVIGVRTVSRRASPAPGSIARYVMSREGATVRSHGRELRNEPTASVLLGGAVHEMVPVLNPDGGGAIWPFWGADANGVPVVGVGRPEEWHEAVLDASEVADVVGSPTYHVTIPELRAALMDFESWAAYVMRWYPEKADAIGLANSVDSTSDLGELFPDGILRRDLIAEGDLDAYQLGRMNEADYWTARAGRAFDFVRRHAAENFGRNFLVRVPFQLSWTVEPETTNVIASEEVSREGGYAPDGSPPLGLAYADVDPFLAEDGRFGCFARFPLAPSMDLSRLSPDDAVASNGWLFLRAEANPGVHYLPGDPYPYVVVTLADAVHDVMPDPLGGVADVAGILGLDPEEVAAAAGERFGSFPVRIAPPPRRPDAIALPMRSNRRSYGPWHSSGGIPGRVSFERDETLVPWAFGGFGGMDAVAAARVANAAVGVSEAEVGEVEFPGLPDRSPGDELVDGGPVLARVSMRFGAGGCSTSYAVQSFTPAFGAFARHNAERIRRFGLGLQQARKQARALWNRRGAAARLERAAARGWMENAAHAVAQRTPHDAVYAGLSVPGGHGVRAQAALATADEMFANTRPDDPEAWRRMGGMGLEGLLRPFSISTDPEVAGGLPHYEEPPADVQVAAFTSKAIHVHRGLDDLDLAVSGREFKGLHRLKRGVDPTDARLVGLAGPVDIVGWGSELTGKPIPNAADETLPLHEWSADFAGRPASRPELWRAGKLDVAFDKWRGVWAPRIPMKVVLEEELAADGGGTALAKFPVGGGFLEDKVRVMCDLGGDPLAAGTTCWASYNALENRWEVTSAGCGA